MPELPEVDAIAGVAARHSLGQVITSVHVIRQPRNNAYFHGPDPTGGRIDAVYRRGKHVLFSLVDPTSGTKAWIDCHNAMTGFWDYEDDLWSFDYVEGPRDPSEHVRVTMSLSNGRKLRFHDARFFGRLRVVSDPTLAGVGPELMVTPHGDPRAPLITLPEFAQWVLSERRPIKHALMDQSRLAGIGNIYSNEACHLVGLDPHTAGEAIRPGLVPLLLEALVCVVSHSIPKVQYQWRNVYRRDSCGSCGHVVKRTEVAKRGTFMCEICQGEPRWNSK